MKLFFNLFGMALAGVLGYVAEPALQFRLTGIEPSSIQKAKNANVVIQMPGGAPQIDIASLTPAQLPQRVLLNTDVKVSDAGSGVTMTIQAGNRVKLLRIDGGNAVVSPGDGPFQGLVPITDTDLGEQIAARPPTTAAVASTPVTPDPAPAVTPPAPVEPPPAVTPEPISPTVAEVGEPEKMAEPTPVVPEVTPQPETTPVPAGATPTEAGTTDVVKAMQDSIKAAQIKEFAFDQVLEWKPDAEEVVDGETYKTGLASYKAETIFGVKTIQAKALIKDGKVQRWIWPKSGMEIK